MNEQVTSEHLLQTLHHNNITNFQMAKELQKITGSFLLCDFVEGQITSQNSVRDFCDFEIT